MKIENSNGVIRLDKQLNALDKFTIDFASVLDKSEVKYVLVSGYVSILFGRSRSSEDIDIVLEKLSFEKFKKLWAELDKSFKCIITEDPKEAYEKYLLGLHAIRFSRKGAKEFIPNMEVKFPKIEPEKMALEQRKKVILNGKELFISPIELQIAFKLFLGQGENEKDIVNEKDIEDAKYLYDLFRDKIDLKLLEELNRKLNIEYLFNTYLK